MSTPNPPSTVFVLFGATGDLARRMVLPALFELARRSMLPERPPVGELRAGRYVGRPLTPMSAFLVRTRLGRMDSTSLTTDRRA